MIVDVHCHLVPRDFAESFPGFRIAADPEWGERLCYGDRMLGPMIPRIAETSVLLEDSDRFGVDVRAACTGSWLFCYWADPDLGERFARAYNDRIATEAQAHPGRIVGLATVPLQDPTRAVAELRRAVEQLRLPGVAVGTNVNGRYYDEPEFFPFFEAVQDLGVPVFFHPNEVAGGAAYKPYRLTQFIGNPHDATLSLVRMVLGGVLERLPRLKLCFPMAGGSLPLLIGRIDHGWSVHPEARVHVQRKPSEYVRSCYFDTITHSADTLEFALRFVPAGQFLMGSDYPWKMGEPTPGQSIRAVPGLDDQTRADMLGNTAARLLGIATPTPASPWAGAGGS